MTLIAIENRRFPSIAEFLPSFLLHFSLFFFLFRLLSSIQPFFIFSSMYYYPVTLIFITAVCSWFYKANFFLSSQTDTRSSFALEFLQSEPERYKKLRFSVQRNFYLHLVTLIDIMQWNSCVQMIAWISARSAVIGNSVYLSPFFFFPRFIF